jgi:hypothetical protein
LAKVGLVFEYAQSIGDTFGAISGGEFEYFPCKPLFDGEYGRKKIPKIINSKADFRLVLLNDSVQVNLQSEDLYF